MIAEMVGGTNTQREYNLGLERKFLQELYKLHSPHEEFIASYQKMGELTGTPANLVGNVIKLMVERDLLTRRFEYHGGSGIGTKDAGGRVSFWTLRTDFDNANRILAKRQQEMLSRTRKTNGAAHVEAKPVSKLPQETSGNRDAIDKAQQLVDSVRQYLKANDMIHQNLQSLREAGIQVDEAAYLNSVSIKPDASAEAISLVMPYIDYLEAKGNK